jgi:hypothetical protein
MLSLLVGRLGGLSASEVRDLVQLERPSRRPAEFTGGNIASGAWEIDRHRESKVPAVASHSLVLFFLMSSRSGTEQPPVS